jgi:hypothetical protein
MSARVGAVDGITAVHLVASGVDPFEVRDAVEPVALGESGLFHLPPDDGEERFPHIGRLALPLVDVARSGSLAVPAESGLRSLANDLLPEEPPDNLPGFGWLTGKVGLPDSNQSGRGDFSAGPDMLTSALEGRRLE